MAPTPWQVKTVPLSTDKGGGWRCTIETLPGRRAYGCLWTWKKQTAPTDTNVRDAYLAWKRGRLPDHTFFVIDPATF